MGKDSPEGRKNIHDHALDPIVFGVEGIEGGDQEAARTTGQVQDPDSTRFFQVIQPDTQVRLGGAGAGLAGAMRA